MDKKWRSRNGSTCFWVSGFKHSWLAFPSHIGGFVLARRMEEKSWHLLEIQIKIKTNHPPPHSVVVWTFFLVRAFSHFKAVAPRDRVILTRLFFFEFMAYLTGPPPPPAFLPSLFHLDCRAAAKVGLLILKLLAHVPICTPFFLFFWFRTQHNLSVLVWTFVGFPIALALFFLGLFLFRNFYILFLCLFVYTKFWSLAFVADMEPAARCQGGGGAFAVSGLYDTRWVACHLSMFTNGEATQDEASPVLSCCSPCCAPRHWAKGTDAALHKKRKRENGRYAIIDFSCFEKN